MLRSCKYILAGLSFFLVINTRRGSTSLQVMIGGSGKRPSMLMLGGINFDDVEFIGIEGLRKRPGLSGTSMLGLN